MKFIIIFVPSRNVISRSHVVILLALFHVDYDWTFGVKNVIIFHQTQKNLHLVYQMSIDKYVRRSSSEQCCQLCLSNKSVKGVATMNPFDSCYLQNFDNVPLNSFYTVWKFNDFSITQILREINFGDSRGAKILHFLNAENFQIQSPSNCKKRQFENI